MARNKRKDRLEKLKRVATDAASAPNEKEIAKAEIKRLEADKKAAPGEPPDLPPQNLPLYEYGLVAGQPEPKKGKTGGLPGFMPGPKKPKGLPKTR